MTMATSNHYQWNAGNRLWTCTHFAEYICQGLAKGFRIGATLPHNPSQLRSAKRNHRSAYDHPKELTHQLEGERLAGRLQCPLQAGNQQSEPTHISPLGLIPKQGQPGKWRLIMDLSSPRQRSTNDLIDPELCTLKYAAIDQALLFIRAIGHGCSLAKWDLKSAYRMVPVHPDTGSSLG